MSDLTTQAPALERIDLFEVVDGRVVEKPPMGALEVFLASSLMHGLPRSWLKPISVASSRKCSSSSRIRRNSNVVPTSPSFRPSVGPLANVFPGPRPGT